MQTGNNVDYQDSKIKPKNLFGSYYIGPNNPKDNDDKDTFKPVPVSVLDFFALVHDRDYDRVQAKGATDAFLNTKTLNADINLTGRSLGYSALMSPMNPYESGKGAMVGTLFLVISISKTIQSAFEN